MMVEARMPITLTLRLFFKLILSLIHDYHHVRRNPPYFRNLTILGLYIETYRTFLTFENCSLGSSGFS